MDNNRRHGGKYKMLFGKYKSQPIDEVPTSYLRWLLSQPDTYDHTRYEIMDELGQRGKLFDEAIMQIVYLKAEVHKLKQLLSMAGTDSGEKDDDRSVRHNSGGYVPGRDEV